MSSSKNSRESLSFIWQIMHELKRSINKDKISRDPSLLRPIIKLFRDNQVTEKRFCRPENHYTYFADTYLTYLRSTRLQDEITKKYFLKGERSPESAAKLVGLEMPKQSN